MVKFEQKEFFAPLALLNGASMLTTVASGVKGMADSSTQTELQEKQLQQQRVDSYRQQKAQQDQIAATNNLANATQNLANNPASTATTKPAVTNTLSNMNMKVGMNTIKPMTKAYSSRVQFKRKTFGFALGKMLGNTAKSFLSAPETPATTWKGFVKESTPLATGMSTFGAVSGVMGNVQASKGIKEMKAGLANMKSQAAGLKTQSDNLVSDINSAASSLRTYSDNSNQSNIKFRQRNYGFIGNLGRKYYKSEFGKTVNGLGKIAGDLAYDHRGKLIGGVLGGAGMAAIHYGVNKGVQHNMNKNGIDMAAIRDMQKEDQQRQQQMGPQQQMYADVDSNLIREAGRDQYGNITHWDYFAKNADGKKGQLVKTGKMTGGQWAGHMVKEHAVGPMALGFSGLFEVPNVIGYAKEKDQLKALSDMARARKGLSPLPGKRVPGGNQQQPQQQQTPQFRQAQPQQQQQKMYGAVGHWISNKIRGFNNWKKAPVQNTLNTIDKFGGGRGLEGVDSMSKRLTDAGKQNNSQFLQKAGDWWGKHKKTALATSAGLGFVAIGKTMELGEDLVKKPLKAIDPNAYAYDDYKEQQIQ